MIVGTVSNSEYTPESPYVVTHMGVFTDSNCSQAFLLEDVAMKKLTIEYVRGEIEKAGYELLSDAYVNNDTKLKVRCNKGHVYETSWRGFNHNYRCVFCAIQKRSDGQRFKIDDIKVRTKELAVGYTCLSNEYKRNSEDLLFRCDKGHEYKASWNRFARGDRCPYCAGLKRKTITYVKEMTPKIAFGYSCLSTNYVNTNSKLKFICNKGHVYESTWNNFYNVGNRCPKCNKENQSIRQRFTIEYVKKRVPEIAKGYSCLSNEYLHSSSKLLFRCDQGHEYETSWASFANSNNRCPICSGNKKYTIEEIKVIVQKSAPGYILLSDTYTNCGDKLKFRCDQGHEYEVVWGSFNTLGSRCPSCAGLKKLLIADIKRMVSELSPGYVCLSNTYINTHSKLRFRCNKGHEYNCIWNHFQRGHRCRVCYYESQHLHDDDALQNISWYRAVVTRYSNENFCKYYYRINPNSLERSYTGHHLDHIYTVIDGFTNSILPQIIANPTNLQMLSAFDNYSKNGQSDMTKEELFERYEQFNKEKENE